MSAKTQKAAKRSRLKGKHQYSPVFAASPCAQAFWTISTPPLLTRSQRAWAVTSKSTLVEFFECSSDFLRQRRISWRQLLQRVPVT